MPICLCVRTLSCDSSNVSAYQLFQGILPEDSVLDVDDFLVTIVHKKKKKKERLTVFLHSNCVLLAVKEKKDEIHPPIYVYQEHLLCSNLTLSKEFKGKHKFALSDGPIATSDTVYVLQHVDEEDTMAVKEKWTGMIENLLMKQFEALKGVYTATCRSVYLCRTTVCMYCMYEYACVHTVCSILVYAHLYVIRMFV